MRTTKKCKNCNHIYWSDEQHVCPTEEEVARWEQLTAAAAQYDEDNWVGEDGKHYEK